MGKKGHEFERLNSFRGKKGNEEMMATILKSQKKIENKKMKMNPSNQQNNAHPAIKVLLPKNYCREKIALRTIPEVNLLEDIQILTKFSFILGFP